MKNVPFLITTVILVGIIAFSVAITAKGQGSEAGANAEAEAYYRQMEEQLLDDIKAYLSELGFTNSGVTLNRIVDASENREYTFTIHHSRIDKMDAASRHDLQTTLSQNNPVADMDAFAECTFHYKFLLL